MLQLGSYSGSGASEWIVHCKGTFLPRDYIVAIPERSKDNARVLKCHASAGRFSSCSVVGPSDTAAARLTEAS